MLAKGHKDNLLEDLLEEWEVIHHIWFIALHARPTHVNIWHEPENMVDTQN